jgi:hypothetical protein
MIQVLLIWVGAAIFVEAITEIIVSSDILFGFRNYIIKLNRNFFGKLVGCGYCMSMWASMPVAWLLPGSITSLWLFDVVIKTFILHRCSNVIHELFSRWFKRLPWYVIVGKNQIEDFPDKVEVNNE